MLLDKPMLVNVPKRLYALIALAVLCIPPAGPVQGADDTAAINAVAGQFYEDALMRFGEGDYRGSIVQLKNALQQDTRHLPSRILLGRAYLKTGQTRQAEVEFKAALEMGADRALIDIPLAETYKQLGKSSDLLADIDPGRHGPADAARLMVLRGRAYLELGQYDKADQSFNEALQLDPRVEGVLVARAMAHLRRFRLEPAKELLDEATMKTPQAAEAWFLKGRVAYEEGQLEEGVANLTRALEADPDYLEARLTRAASLNDLGQLELAQRDLDHLHAQPVVGPTANYLQAIVHFRNGEEQKARESLAKASTVLGSLPPETLTRNPQLRLLAGTVAYVQGNFESAWDQLEAYLERNPGHAKARQMMAHIHLSRNQPELAYKKLRPLLTRLPDDPTVLMLLGQIHLAMKDDKAAADVFEKLAAQRPEDVSLQLNLAQSLIGARQITGAIEALDKAKQLGGQESTAGTMLGILLLNQGRYEEAIEEAISVLPGNRRICWPSTSWGWRDWVQGT